MRILLAALIGGVVMFIWGVAAHMALGLGDPGLRAPAHEDLVLGALHEGLGSEPGVYMLPWLGPAQMGDADAVQAYRQKATTAPYAWIVYQPQARDGTQMGGQIALQWVSDTLAALALAIIMALAPLTFRHRLGLALAAAVFAWLGTLVPYWNWYYFPLSLTLAALVEQAIGWLLAGAAMAWWLGRRERAATR